MSDVSTAAAGGLVGFYPAALSVAHAPPAQPRPHRPPRHTRPPPLRRSHLRQMPHVQMLQGRGGIRVQQSLPVAPPPPPSLTCRVSLPVLGGNGQLLPVALHRGEGGGMQTTLLDGTGPVAAVIRSIGFRHEGAHALAIDGLDLRQALRTPADDPGMRHLTGLDPKVYAHVLNTPGTTRGRPAGNPGRPPLRPCRRGFRLQAPCGEWRTPALLDPAQLLPVHLGVRVDECVVGGGAVERCADRAGPRGAELDLDPLRGLDPLELGRPGAGRLPRVRPQASEPGPLSRPVIVGAASRGPEGRRGGGSSPGRYRRPQVGPPTCRRG
ncbi:hypothetical protein SAMN05428939_0123 [Streptomyces sp. TLI_105]|nr:hypothetical protein SAMN05428939_0123 [Streptomyces sp. TLI_105]